MKAEDIKLIIWDLDDTFWQGIFTEGEISIPKQNIQFLRDTLDMGIIHSICSKNDFSSIKEKLLKDGLWDFFVFPSIDWTPKGARVKGILESMRLRAENVIFIDDNTQNLEEVKHYCPAISILAAQDIPLLIAQVQNLEKKDIQHKRLKQYHQMERKEQARIDYKSNEDFLYSCNIQVEINKDCLTELDRIHELVMRSNQLNYTKYRQSKEDLRSLIEKDDVLSGYVHVQDKFGDYGLVGFYAIQNGEVVHYVFSCRTLGMRVEQYVYSQLGYPKICVQGEVVSKLDQNDCPRWINQVDCVGKQNGVLTNNVTKKILLKGPCDMSQMYAFFNTGDAGSIATEFTYLNDEGVSVEGHNHTAQIVTALYSSDKRKQEILSDVCFFDKDMLQTQIADRSFDAVVLSMLTDGNLGVYRRKSTGELIAFGQKTYPLNSDDNRDKYIKGDIFTSRVNFNVEMIDTFSESYDFVDNSDFSVTMECLEQIYKKIPTRCKLVLLLGSERPFPKACEQSYDNRHIEHQKMNDLIREWGRGKENVFLLSYDTYITSDSDFIDTINHFTKKVYYGVAKDIIAILNDVKDNQFAIKGKHILLASSLRQKLSIIKKRMIKQ